MERYLELVQRLAAKRSRELPHCVDVADLMSDGMLGLMDAVERYNPGRGCAFTTFAARRIFGAMTDGIREVDWVPRLERRRIKEGTAQAVGLHSLSSPLETGEPRGSAHGRPLALANVLADPQAASGIDAADRSDWLKQICLGLDRAETLILTLYYAEDITMAEIGRAVGMSESRVSQIHSQLLLRIRARLERDGPL